MDCSWCPACDRLIPPKRYEVPIDDPPPSAPASPAPQLPPPPPAPTPVASSSSAAAPAHNPAPAPAPRKRSPRTHKKGGGGGHALGLLHGTGRVRPGGGLKPAPPAPAPVAPPPPPVRRTMVVIDQGPTPLYCSEACRVRDLQNSFIDSQLPGFSTSPQALRRAQRTLSSIEGFNPSLTARRPKRVVPPAPPNSLVVEAPLLARHASSTSASSSASASSSRTRSSTHSLLAAAPGAARLPKAAPVAPKTNLFTVGASSDSPTPTTSSEPMTPASAATSRRVPNAHRKLWQTSHLVAPALALPRSKSTARALLPGPPLQIPHDAIAPPPTQPLDGLARWPEDDRRVSGARAENERLVLDVYAGLWRPREGRALEGAVARDVEGRRRRRAAREARGRESTEARERREAEERRVRRLVQREEREEEERYMEELLGGRGMRREDQPQARRLQPLAYDGRPCPHEQRGLTYDFDKFRYPLMMPSPIGYTERVEEAWDEQLGCLVERTVREPIYEERKKLFNFVADHEDD